MSAYVVDREEIDRALDATGFDEENVREDYSGRAMYGATCFGLVCDLGDLLMFVAALGSAADEWDWVGGARSDSMGRSTIWYWPGVSLSGGES